MMGRLPLNLSEVRAVPQLRRKWHYVSGLSFCDLICTTVTLGLEDATLPTARGSPARRQVARTASRRPGYIHLIPPIQTLARAAQSCRGPRGPCAGKEVVRSTTGL